MGALTQPFARRPCHVARSLRCAMCDSIALGWAFGLAMRFVVRQVTFGGCQGWTLMRLNHCVP
jgi:hypothetical protein